MPIVKLSINQSVNYAMFTSLVNLLLISSLPIKWLIRIHVIFHNEITSFYVDSKGSATEQNVLQNFKISGFH